jgi:predicted amidohydrolase YtcJ
VTANAIYLGNVVTMSDVRPTAEAVAIAAGRIVAVGPRDEVLARHKGPATR